MSAETQADFVFWLQSSILSNRYCGGNRHNRHGFNWYAWGAVYCWRAPPVLV
ncbi:hypothetical protein QTO34_014366 [Cnephaeus nilssonii]|uniref:Uncharacterized protein n=1 Tax=Cnephaeus nilssonii TaxID=3371016 RepID=A0AA40LTX9_CNENI|nr:hypothetical protein QTO34_014366 [Eptesicus nilssonii]